MCDPVTLGVSSMAIGAASSIAQYGQAEQAAERQNAFAQANSYQAKIAQANSYAADQTQLIQERNKASQQSLQAELRGAEAQGTAVTAAGQAGVGGLSVDQLVQDYAARASRYRSDVDANYAGESQYMQGVEQSQHDQTISRINSVPRAVGPSLLSAGLGILSAGVGGMGQYYQDERLSHTGGSGNPMNMDGYGGSY